MIQARIDSTLRTNGQQFQIQSSGTQLHTIVGAVTMKAVVKQISESNHLKPIGVDVAVEWSPFSTNPAKIYFSPVFIPDFIFPYPDGKS